MPIAGMSRKSSQDAEMCGVLCGDSSAAIAVSQRKGCGKLRHIRIGQLWIQERVNDKDIGLRKIAGEVNPSDLMTKHVNEQKMLSHCELLHVVHREGRSDLSLKVQQGIALGNATAV